MPAARLAALLAATLVLTACTGDGDGGGGGAGAGASDGPSTAAAPAVLSSTWSAVAGHQAPAVATDDLLVFLEDGVVRTLDRGTGETLSVFRSGRLGGLCSISPQVSRDHVLGLMIDEKGSPPCTLVAALDVRAGRLLWRRALASSDPNPGPGGRDPYHQGRSVAVGDRTLLATTTCSEVRRLSLRDGRPLGVLAPRDTACRNTSVTDGSVVAILDYDPGDEPEDPSPSPVPGWIPARDGDGAFAVYDADSGRRRWVHSVPDHNTAAMSDVVSTDPLVLTSAVHGRTSTRVWDERGRPGPFLGRSTPFSLSEEPGLQVVGRTDGLVVVTYPSSPTPQVLHAYDLTNGAARWRLVPPVTGALVSVAGDRLLMAVPGGSGTDLLGYDVAAPGSPRLLGHAEGRAVALEGDLLLTGGDDLFDGGPLTAYPAPDESVDGNEDVAWTPPESALDDEWEYGDVRPEEVVDACEAVTRRTLSLVGMAWGDLPAPSDCRWSRLFLPDYVSTRLDVTVRAARSGLGADGERMTATEAATALAATAAGGDEPLPELAAGARLGDQAWGAFGAGDDDPIEGHPVRMVTRWRNVVVDVTAGQELELEDRATALVPYDRLQDAVYAATADVLTGLGAEVTPPARGRAGSTDGVGDLCPALAPLAAELVPGGRASTGHAGRQQRSCVWHAADASDDLDALVVVADAVPGAADGTAADRRAVQVARLLGRPGRAEQHIDGLPGASTRRRYVHDDYLVWDVTSRVGNLVVWVHLASYHDGATPAGMDERTARAMRVAVRAATGGQAPR